MTTLDRINAFQEARQGPGFRKHLGASLIGRPCARQLWYVFRWAKRQAHRGRILRLFSRGESEEDHWVKRMREAGIHVLSRDPATGDQFRVSDHDGHFGGSLDAKLFDTPEYPGIWILGEFKTHNDKSFKEIKKQGVEESKYEHFVQMQIYMHYEKLPAALYIGVNKNDDDVYAPIVEYRPEIAEQYISRAGAVIYNRTPPARIPNASPGWYLCRFCDYMDICHHHAKKEMNCRTCVNAFPDKEGQWKCLHFEVMLTDQDQKQGCLQHREIVED